MLFRYLRISIIKKKNKKLLLLKNMYPPSCIIYKSDGLGKVI